MIECIEYKLLRTLVENHYGLPFPKYVAELKEAIENAPTNKAEILKKALSRLTTPEKIKQILEQDKMKSLLNDLAYDPESKTLTYKGTKLLGLTKLITLLWIVTLYAFTVKEELGDVGSPYLEKALEYIKGVATSKILLSTEDINIDLLNDIFNKAFSSIPLAGILCYLTVVAVLDEKFSVIFLSHLTKLLSDTGDSFGMSFYWLILKSRKLLGKNVYIEFLADEIYNNLYAVGIAQTPLSVLKTKLVERQKTTESKEESTANALRKET